MREDEIFAGALELQSPTEREAYLHRVCAGDEALRRRVEALLASDDEAGAFLEQRATELAAVGAGDKTDHPRDADFELIADGRSVLAGDARIGAYRLLEKIGEGGMGVVYMAQQERPVRRLVALKVIKPGMDSARVIARFETERQALAVMNHPNIAAVHDAGMTGDGRPYFVMELVKGVPITQFCDENHLTPRQRLDLFLPVCGAIHHAHQKGIIHRDIKPSNVLVACYDEKAVPKVIDFGVAKALGPALIDEAPVTMFGGIIGTLNYMSPEQATFNALDVDTRTDVYALGALLYELLTGEPPLKEQLSQRVAMQKLLETIRDTEPLRPSTRLGRSGELPARAARLGVDAQQLSRSVRGELDLIVMKALHKERTQRYDSASGLARDIERFLRGDPVEACPPTWRYRAAKFVRRYRGPIAAALLLIAALIAGIIGTAWGLYRALDSEEGLQHALINERDARQQAEKARTEAETARGAAEAARSQAELARLNAEAARKQAEIDADRAERAAYGQRIALAEREIEAANILKARKLLVDCPPELRHFEWHRLRHMLDLSRTRLPGNHWGPINGVAFSRDGSRIVSACSDGHITIWDGRTLKKLFQFPAHTAPVMCVAISADGSRIASGGKDGIKIWDTLRPALPFSLHLAQPLIAMKGHTGAIMSLNFSPDGSHIVSGSGPLLLGNVQIWDARRGGEPIHTFNDSLASHSVTYSGDGQWIVAAIVAGDVKVWDANDLTKPPVTIAAEIGTMCVAVSHDASLIVAGMEDAIKVWRRADPSKPLFTLRGHRGLVQTVAISNDNKRIVSGSTDRTIKVWDAEKGGGPLVSLHGHLDAVASVAISADRSQIVSGSLDTTVKLWDQSSAQRSNMVFPIEERSLNHMTFSTRGDRMIAWQAKNTLALYDTHGGGKPIWSLEVPRGVHAVTFVPDGDHIVTAESDHTVRVREAATGNETALFRGHTGIIDSVAVSGNGERIASAGRDLSVKVWNANDPSELPRELKREAGTVQSLDISRDGKLVVASRYSNPEVSVWNVERSDAPVLTLDTRVDRVPVVRCSPDGLRIVTGGADGKITFWDAVSGKPLFVLEGHVSDVRSLGFSGDGKRLVSASLDRTIKLWDAENGGDALLTLTGTDAWDHVMFDDAGARLLAVTTAKVITIWPAAR